MINKIKCWLGWHKYIETVLRGLNIFNKKPFQYEIQTCKYCNKFSPGMQEYLLKKWQDDLEKE